VGQGRIQKRAMSTAAREHSRVRALFVVASHREYFANNSANKFARRLRSQTHSGSKLLY
jgi:hypothetical protein